MQKHFYHIDGHFLFRFAFAVKQLAQALEVDVSGVFVDIVGQQVVYGDTEAVGDGNQLVKGYVAITAHNLPQIGRRELYFWENLV